MSVASAVLVSGTIGIDTVHTPIETRRRVSGGSAPYFARAAALFAPVRLSGVVGYDYPPEHRRFLERSGIDLAGLETDTEHKTFAWEGRYHDNFIDRETIQTELNALETYSSCLPEVYRDTPYVFLANNAPALQLAVLDQLDSPRFVAADTMNLWINTALDDLKKLLPRLQMLVVNDEEARMLSGEFTMPRCAAAIRRMGPEWVVIKRGEHGAFGFGAGTVAYVPACLLEEIIDPTGAGDSFAGGMLGRLAQLEAGVETAEAIRDAMAHGSVTGACACEGFGLEGIAAADPAGVRERLELLRKMSRIP